MQSLTRRVNAHDRQMKALELRKAGMTIREISAALGYRSPTAAHAAIKSALSRITYEEVEELRTIELERLDRLQAGVWKDAAGGDLKAIDRVLRIMERRSKLCGLDAPTKMEHFRGIDVASLTDEELQAIIDSEG